MARSLQLGILWAGALSGVVLLAGCTRDGRYQPLGMWDDARLKPYEPVSEPNGSISSARIPPTGTIPVGALRFDDPVMTGRRGAQLLSQIPYPVTRAVLERGQERFNIFCSPCHGRLGDGRGMITQRGFPHPPDYAIQRLRRAPVGHFFDVMTHGYGIMYSYASRVNVNDRWAIAAYIRVLQKQRPVVTEDPYEAERERARQTGILDPGARQNRRPEGTSPTGVPDAHGAPVPGGPAGGNSSEPVGGQGAPGH